MTCSPRMYAVVGVLAACMVLRLDAVQDPVIWVDPMIGTGGTGHTFPGPCRPFGFVQPSPDTGNGSWRYCGGYAADDREIRCFSQTHVSGAGQAGLGDVAVMPIVKSAVKRNEQAKLGYYCVDFENGERVEIAAGRRIARYRFTFPEGTSPRVRFDFAYGLYREKGYLPHLTTTSRVECASARALCGYNHSDIWCARDFWYVCLFDRDIESFERGVCTFAGSGPIELSIAISARSADGAERNLRAEEGLSFDELVAETRREWRTYLSRFSPPAESSDERIKIFYTALYHVCIQPNDISDAGEQSRYTTFSLWDTYRTAHPLYEKLVPELIPGFVNSLLEHYDRFGYLPRWELWGRETNCMIGDHAVPVIVNAYLHGFRGFDVEKAYRAIRESLTGEKRVKHANFYLPREDRVVYDRYGYFPYDIVDRESVSRTLECAIDDYKASEFARALGRDDDAAFFEKRSWGFTNLFDHATFCFRPKDSSGRWLVDFDPSRQSVHYTEGSPLQYSWYVPYRVDWLIEAMGGREKFIGRLDAFFDGTLFPGQSRDYSIDVTGLIGDYAHGNEPCHYIPYLYAAAGRPDKTDIFLREICRKFYHARPDGLCGNEDCGQMSAWYLLAIMGFYPSNLCVGGGTNGEI